ncbi:hypothetical protein HG531_013351 [Fusarium graminearum]|nr:hypothetical protein HG531_013351 [Fusarium graminearum]
MRPSKRQGDIGTNFKNWFQRLHQTGHASNVFDSPELHLLDLDLCRLGIVSVVQIGIGIIVILCFGISV